MPLYNPTPGIVSPSTDNAIVRFDGTTGQQQDSGILISDGNAIQADFTNATLTSRAYFQTTTGNSTSVVGALPSGSGTNAFWAAYNNSTPTNSAICYIGVSNTEGSVDSSSVGSGTVLPLSLKTNTLPRIVIRPSSSTAQTTNGQGIQIPASTWTDTSSSGTVALTAAHSIAVPTLAASSSTTYTKASTLRLGGAPSPGTNVTITSSRSIITESGANEFIATSSGATTVPLLLSNAQTTTSSGAAIGFIVSSASTIVAQITAIRTNRAVSADTDLVFSTFSNSALAERFRIRDDGLQIFAEAANVQYGTTTGTQLGTGTTQKLAFHGSTAVVQRAGAAQAAVATTAATNVTPYGYTTQAQADSIVTLVNELRAALVEKGLIKGSA